jgi:hypothetical protein
VIPNVVKGGDIRGLMYYLVSTDDTRSGNANAHTDPHVIGGDAHMQAWYGAQDLTARDAGDIADYLDRPRQVFGTENPASVWEQDPTTGERRRVVDAAGQPVMRDVNTWHCSLSLPPGEVLSAERWEALTAEFMDRMDFTDTSGKAPCRWVAIHHGVGKGGHDHVHIAASMVREDGTKWAGQYLDFNTAQKVCRDLEVKHGLAPVLGPVHGTTGRGVKPAEAARATGGLTDRQRLEHGVRAAAVASVSEAEWVRRVRQAGIVVKPRFASGTTDVVVGYRVALHNPGGRLNFYAGGTLGADLSLPRMREAWPEPGIDQANAAAAEWQAAFHGARSLGSGAGRDQLRPSAGGDARVRLDAFTRRLAETPVTDRVAWSHAARDMSGALSAWARFDPAHADQLRTAAAAIARTAQDRRPGEGSRRTAESPGMAALVLLAAGGDVRVQTAVMMTAILQAADALRRYHRDSGNLAEARRLVAAVKPLQDVHRDYAAATPAQQAPARGRTGTGRQVRTPAPRGPLPTQLGERGATAVRGPSNVRGRNDDGRDR